MSTLSTTPITEQLKNALHSSVDSAESLWQQRVLNGKETQSAEQKHTDPSDNLTSTNATSEISSLLTLQTMREKLNHKFCNAFTERSLLVDFLAILFGIGTWVGVNGLFVELPLIVKTAPEAWSLPSYLSVMVQIGNLGPLIYTLLQRCSLNRNIDNYLIYMLLTLGTIAVLLVAFFYNRTAYLFGAEHSVALFVLTIGIAINACTSSVLFTPYMGRFKEMYLVTFFVGEGLSGLLPSLVALIQGIGGKTICRLVNDTTTGAQIWQEYTPPARFGSTAFFLCLFALMLCSFLGYTLLDNLPTVRNQYAKMQVSFGNDYVYEQNEQPDASSVEAVPQNKLSSTRFWLLLILLASITFFSNGVYSSIQSYSAGPYGTNAYHLVATLGAIANPVACFLAVFLPHTSLRSIPSLSAVMALLNVYVFVTASMSPTPPLVDTAVGPVLIIIIWTLLHGLISYVKLSINTVMRNQGGKSLVWAGTLTQVGSFCGSILGFVLVNVTHSFTEAKTKPCPH